jgi:hypothetical protein
MLRSNCTLGRKSSNAKFFTSLVLHGIELTDPTPVWTPPYPIPLIKDQFLSYLKGAKFFFTIPTNFGM